MIGSPLAPRRRARRLARSFLSEAQGGYMRDIVATLAVAALLAGCGAGISGTAGAGAEAQQAAQARQHEERVRQGIEAAQAQAAQQRAEAEKQGQ